MRKILILLIMLSGILALNNCEKESVPVPDIKLVSVYTVVNNDAVWSFEYGNVYREKDLYTVWEGSAVRAFGISDFTDNSTTDSFLLSFTAYEDSIYVRYDSLLEPIDSTFLEKVYEYAIQASKVDSMGVMDVNIIYPDSVSTLVSIPTQDVLMYNSKVYN